MIILFMPLLYITSVKFMIDRTPHLLILHSLSFSVVHFGDAAITFRVLSFLTFVALAIALLIIFDITPAYDDG